MSASGLIYLFTAAALTGCGLYGVLIAGHLLRKLLALNLMGAGIFLLLITLAAEGSASPDPVPQALVLTGIVVAVSATGFALALLLALHRVSGQTSLDEDEPQQ